VLGARTHAYCGREILNLNPGMQVQQTATVEMPSQMINLRRRFAAKIGVREGALPHTGFSGLVFPDRDQDGLVV
jgi:hypothetical protein